ncbi:MAG: 6-phosphogluconolactonase [Ignavibacteriaceae bacterium]
MNSSIKIFDSPPQLALKLAEEFNDVVEKKSDNIFISISGGSTPKIFFRELTLPPFGNNIDWSKVHLFWSDERCVPPSDSGSNYGMTKKNLLDFIQIPAENIHRIMGESHPEKESVRYSKEIDKILPSGNDHFPQFDWVFLGMGEDGHTASLFPNAELLYSCSNIAGVAIHPVSGQKRISLTERIINNSKRISFVVTGKNKASILKEILDGLPESKNYPASRIKPLSGNLDWWIDKEAALYL